MQCRKALLPEIKNIMILDGGDRIGREGESRVSYRQALLTLMLLAAGEREDLWHPRYVFVGTKSFTLFCIYGDCNVTCLATSQKKLDFCSAFEIRLLIYQDK